MLLSILRVQSENVMQYAKEEEIKVRNMADTGINYLTLSVQQQYNVVSFFSWVLVT